LATALGAEKHSQVIHRVGGHETSAKEIPERVLH
jgi:hypothetical protein